MQSFEVFFQTDCGWFLRRELPYDSSMLAILGYHVRSNYVQRVRGASFRATNWSLSPCGHTINVPRNICVLTLSTPWSLCVGRDVLLLNWYQSEIGSAWLADWRRWWDVASDSDQVFNCATEHSQSYHRSQCEDIDVFWVRTGARVRKG